VLGVLIPLHLATATLLPSLVVVAAAAPGSTGRRAARAAAAVGACGAVAGLLFAAAGFDVAARLGEVRGGNLLPLLAEPTFRQAYRLLSPRHLTDFASQYLLAAPAAVMGIPLLRRAPGGRGGAFLVTAAAFPVLFGFVANPEVGAFRDWDVMSLAAVPLTLAVAVRLARGPRAADVAVLLAGAAALHTLAWVAGNADAAAAEARFVRLLRSCPASLHARAYGWESLARVYLGDGRTDAACTAFERAADFAPDNPRYWSSAATLHLEAGRADAAERCFARTVELDPTRAEAWQALGAIRYGRGDLEGALRFLAEALRLRPDLERAWFNRGLAELRLGRRREAAESFRSAVRADPALAPAWFNLGAVLRDLGDDAGAADAFRRFLGLGVGGAQAEEARRWLEARGSG
jgi:tetratricopeptide (TPR) repeat protein